MEAKSYKDGVYIKIYGEEITKLKKELLIAHNELKKYSLQVPKREEQDFTKFLKELNKNEMNSLGVSEQDLKKYVDEARLSITKL